MENVSISENQREGERIHDTLMSVYEKMTGCYGRIVAHVDRVERSPDLRDSLSLAGFLVLMRSRNETLLEIRRSIRTWEVEFFLKWRKALKDMYSLW